MKWAQRRQRRKKNTKKLAPQGNIFERANRAMNAAESSILNLIAAVAPWGAPLAPATMMWNGLVFYMHFPRWVAWVVAGVVEFVGLTTIHTAIQFWQHNRRYAADQRRMPVKWAIGMFGMYLAIVLAVNVLLDAFSDQEPIPVTVRIIVRTLVSLLSVPAGMTLALRALQVDVVAEWLREVAKAQATRVANKEASKKQPAETVSVSETPGPISAQLVAQRVSPVNRSALVREYHAAHPDWSRMKLAEEADVSPQLVSRIVGKDGKTHAK